MGIMFVSVSTLACVYIIKMFSFRNNNKKMLEQCGCDNCGPPDNDEITCMNDKSQPNRSSDSKMILVYPKYDHLTNVDDFGTHLQIWQNICESAGISSMQLISNRHSLSHSSIITDALSVACVNSTKDSVIGLVLCGHGSVSGDFCLCNGGKLTMNQIITALFAFSGTLIIFRFQCFSRPSDRDNPLQEIPIDISKVHESLRILIVHPSDHSKILLSDYTRILKTLDTITRDKTTIPPLSYENIVMRSRNIWRNFPATISYYPKNVIISGSFLKPAVVKVRSFFRIIVTLLNMLIQR